LVKLDVIGRPVTLSEREAEEVRDAVGADAGRSIARHDLALLLERGLRKRTTVALNRAEARELGELLESSRLSVNLALLQEAVRRARGCAVELAKRRFPSRARQRWRVGYDDREVNRCRGSTATASVM
jgi:hypothetical protein